MRKRKAVGQIQTITAKAVPDIESTISMGDLVGSMPIQLAFHPGRGGDVILVDKDGAELLIPELAGGDGLYPTDVIDTADGPFTLRAAADTVVGISLRRLK